MLKKVLGFLFPSDDSAREDDVIFPRRDNRKADEWSTLGPIGKYEDQQFFVVRPKEFAEAEEIARIMMQRRPLAIDMQRCGADAQRILDFISGVAYGLHGEIKQISSDDHVFLFAPSGMDVVDNDLLDEGYHGSEKASELRATVRSGQILSEQA